MPHLVRSTHPTREAWLAARKNIIGASECAAVLGISPFMRNVDVWAEKTGRAQAKDLSGNAAVSYGVRMEPAMRCMFQAEHPEFAMEYHQFDIIAQSDLPWLAATLDAELTDIETGEKGVLEIKTVQAISSAVWNMWKNAVPTYYYAQVCHQLQATGFGFGILYAKLVYKDGDSSLRAYRFSREDAAEDMAYITRKEKEFWENNVLADKRPALILPSL